MKPTILCVDDEPLILDSLKGELRGAFGSAYGYEAAESAEEGLEIIEDLVGEGVRLVVIVSDWLMPGMKGDEFLVQVHDRFPEVVKIMLTGQADEASVARARRDGGLFACLHKPLDGERLAATVRAGLERILSEGAP